MGTEIGDYHGGIINQPQKQRQKKSIRNLESDDSVSPHGMMMNHTRTVQK